jgi:hypothetical protein
MSNRATRRSDLHDFRKAGALLTFLIEPSDVRLRGAPLLAHTASNWLNMLPKNARFCICCSSWLLDRQHVGLVLLAVPATIARPTSCSCAGVCRDCVDADLAALEKAAEPVLGEAIPHGRLEPLRARR